MGSDGHKIKAELRPLSSTVVYDLSAVVYDLSAIVYCI
jgi:hypothetical protein